MKKLKYGSALAILSVLTLAACGDGKSETPAEQVVQQQTNQTQPYNGVQNQPWAHPTATPYPGYGYNGHNTVDPCNPQTNQTANGAPCNPNSYLPQPPNQGFVQVGCYYAVSSPSNCQPCPVGYYQNGNQCMLQVVQYQQQICTGGMVWQGHSCMPQGFTGCPSGMNWNWQIGACGCAYQSYLQQQAMYQRLLLEGWKRKLMWDAAQQQYMAYYYYVANAPRPRCFFNGWGWTSF